MGDTQALLGLMLSSEGKAPQWTHYGASADGDSYSAADQINRNNVAQHAPAWTFHTDEDAATQITFQSTPIEIEAVVSENALITLTEVYSSGGKENVKETLIDALAEAFHPSVNTWEYPVSNC